MGLLLLWLLLRWWWWWLLLLSCSSCCWCGCCSRDSDDGEVECWRLMMSFLQNLRSVYCAEDVCCSDAKLLFWPSGLSQGDFFCWVSCFFGSSLIVTMSTFRNITLAIFPTSKVKVIKTYLLSNPVQVPVEQSSEERREHKGILMITGVFGVKQWLLNGSQYSIQVQYEYTEILNIEL